MMTPIISRGARRLFERGLFRLLTGLFVAVAAGAVGCTDARQGNDLLGGGARVRSSSSKVAISDGELQILGTHISPTISAEFTADGKWIVVSGMDGVTVHDAVSTKCVNWFNGELVEVSPHGLSFLLSRPNGSPELRSIPDGRLMWRLPDDIATRQMHFSDDGRYLVCGYRDLLRIDTREVVYRAPETYRFDTIHGGDHFRDPGDRPRRDDGADNEVASELSVLPYIYRATLRHDARPLIAPGSGLCSPSGRFMIVQTGEEDSSFEPYLSFIDRKTGRRLFSDVRSSDALFFHNDNCVFFGESVYRTRDGTVLFTLEQGITAFAMNSDETLLAAGWRNGQVAVLDPISGEEFFRLTIEERIDTQRHKSGDIVSLAFSEDSAALAAVGRKLTVIDVPSQTVSDVLHLGRGSREVAAPETTSPANIAFNADGSRLLLTGGQGREYIYWRAKTHVLHSTDLGRRRALVSPDYFDRRSTILPVYFNSDGGWAMVPNDGLGWRGDQLELWDTEAAEPVVDISHAFQWHYRRRFVVPDWPKRHLGLGHFRAWYRDELILHPWSMDSLESSEDTELPEGARRWLGAFAQAGPRNTSRFINGRTLYFPAKQWLLRFSNNRIQQLWDLSTGEILAPDPAQLTAQQRRELDAIEVPETCWELAGVEGNAFSPDGSYLLVYCRRHEAKNKDLLALFEMPSGKLVRNYGGHAHIRRIHIAPNSRVAAISTDFYNKTWIIDLETAATLVELPKGGKCVFSPNSRYAQVGDRYGESRSLLTIETGDLIDFEWARRWSFSPNSRYAVGGSGRSWFFLDLATGERTKIPGEVHRTGMSTLSTTKLDFPHQGSRFLCVDKGETRLFDVNAAKSLAKFGPVRIASKCAMGHEKAPRTYASTAVSRYLYTPNDQNFVYVAGGKNVEQGCSVSRSQSVSKRKATEHSTQVLVGDLETGRRIQCSEPTWSRTSLQHKLFTPDGTHFLTISSDKMVCWKLHPLEVAWQTELSVCWTDPETGVPFAEAQTLNWSLGYLIHPSDQSILIAADGREAIMFSLATGEEEQRFGPLPINSVLRFGADGAYLQVGFRANRSMKLYHACSGELVKTYHFTDQGTRLHRSDSIDTQDGPMKNPIRR